MYFPIVLKSTFGRRISDLFIRLPRKIFSIIEETFLRFREESVFLCRKNKILKGLSAKSDFFTITKKEADTQSARLKYVFYLVVGSDPAPSIILSIALCATGYHPVPVK